MPTLFHFLSFFIFSLFLSRATCDVKPVWKTPISEPYPNKNTSSAHSNLAKRAQPNYYTRPEQVSIPDYRSPKQQPHSANPQLNPFSFNQPGGHFRPFAWIGPQPKDGSPQTNYYQNIPNKSNTLSNLPPLPPNWQQYPVQMIWIPDTPGPGPQGSSYNYAGPSQPTVTQTYGQYGPQQTTKEPMKPSVNPETYTGTIIHSPSASPPTSTPYEVPNSYGGSENTQKAILNNSPKPTQIMTSINPTIRPGPREPSAGEVQSTSTPSVEEHNTEKEMPTKPKQQLFAMTNNPYDIGKTVPPVYLGSEEDEHPNKETEDISGKKSSDEKQQYYGVPSADEEEREMMNNFFPRPAVTQAYQPPGHLPEDLTSHINVNFKKPVKCVPPFCKGVDTDKISLYKPDRTEEGSGPTLVISNAAKDDASRAGYKPPPPPLNPYIPPPPPPINQYIPPPPPPVNPQEYSVPYINPPQYQPFPPLREYAEQPPRSLIPAHNFPSPTVVNPSQEYFETTTIPFVPTAQTIQPIFTTNTVPITTSSKPKQRINEEDTPEYIPPAIAHMTASTPAGKNPPTFVPLHPGPNTPRIEKTTAKIVWNTQTPATITRNPEFPSHPATTPNVFTTTQVPNFGGNPPVSPTTTQYIPSEETVTDRISTDSVTFTTRQTSTQFHSTTPHTVVYTDKIRETEFVTPTTMIIAPTEISSRLPPSQTPTIPPAPPKSPYAPPEGAPRVPNRLIGKPRILCKEDGISFEIKTILPLNGEVFANDRKRIAECQKKFVDDAHPKVFLPFDKCGVRNIEDQGDNRAQYHMQVLLIVDQGNGTNTLQSFMAQCVHQKINYNKQALPKRIEEALEELHLVPSKLEQKASMPNVQMQIVVDEGHHKTGPEVSAADIGMPLAIRWGLQPESDAYGMHIRNCKVVDAIGKLEHTLIDEQGCSADLQIIDHPHYDTYHDTASAHMWAFKVPDMKSLQIKCDILICSNIKSSITNTTSCEDIPSPPFCADVVTSLPNSILSDSSSFIKSRRSYSSETGFTTTQSVRTSICLSENCRENFAEEFRVCLNTQMATTSTGLSIVFLMIAISFQIIARSKKQHKK